MPTTAASAAAPYILAAVFAVLALTLLAVEQRARRPEAFSQQATVNRALTQLENAIRCDNETYKEMASRNVTEADDQVDLKLLKKVQPTAAYHVVRDHVKEQASMWEKLSKYINATVANFREATSGPQRNMVSEHEPGAYADVN